MILDCIVKAIFLFLIYNIVSLLIFGVPKSLSTTYYLYKDRLDILKVLFPTMMTMLGMCLMPCWIHLSEGSPFQFLSFLSSAALLFVGFAPAFKSSYLENRVHQVSAYLCAAFAILWIILVTPFWYVILIVFGLVTVLAIVTKTWKTSYIYWLEIVAFVSTFVSILCYWEVYIK
jgi:hypothetical protein